MPVKTVVSRDQTKKRCHKNVNLSLLTLSQVLQLPFDGFDVEIVDLNDPESAEILYNDVKPILNYALENRYEVKVAEKNIESAQLGTKLSKSGYYPSLTAGYGFGSNAFFSKLLNYHSNVKAK